MYDAASDDPRRVQEILVSTDGQSSDPRISLPGAIEAVAGRGDLDAALHGILDAGMAALRR